jgi:NADH dehydrogenase
MSALGARPDDNASQYHRTKWLAEQAVRDSDLAWTIFQPSIIHGPDGEFMQMVKGFWTKAMPPFVPYFGAGFLGNRGAGKLQPVYVEDVARCFAEALTHPSAVGEVYPLVGPDVYAWPQLYRAVKRHLPGAWNKPVLAIPVWKARILARLPGVPFGVDQVIMSQEDSIASPTKASEEFGIKFAAFEPTLAEYLPRM